MNRSESEVQQAVRLWCARKGWHAWRNNNGAGTLENGSFVRWGLANDSAAVNKTIKSADLIGIRPVVITADMVGQTIGQFVSIECKRENWQWRGTPEEVAQVAWRDLVLASGGYATFIANPDIPF